MILGQHLMKFDDFGSNFDEINKTIAEHDAKIKELIHKYKKPQPGIAAQPAASRGKGSSSHRPPDRFL